MVSLLEVRDLSVSLSSSYRLQDVSLCIEPGELIFLLGPSGSGKSTLLRLLSGFLKPEIGKVIFEGNDITETPAHQRGIVMMFQSYALWPHFTVAEHVSFGLEMRGIPAVVRKERIRETLALVGLEALAQRFPHQLSGGQQQRVALARSLAVRPKLLLLDEPLANLDASLRESIGQELIELQAKFSCAMLYVTHDAHDALRYGQRILVMDQGRVVQAGEPHQVYAHPKSALVAQLLGEINILQTTEFLEKMLSKKLPAQFGIRPEALSWAPESTAKLKATLVKREYLGSKDKLRVKLLDSQELSFYCARTTSCPQPGEPIGIALDVNSLIPF